MGLISVLKTIRRRLLSIRGDWVPDKPMLLWRHVARHRRVPNLFRPKRFNEKILARIMFDRRPILSTMADKYAVRDHVRARIGNAALPRLLHVTNDPRTIPFDTLPASFVVKPTHGANWVRVVHDKSALDRGELIAACNGWLGQNYHAITRERAYRNVPPRILVEELVDDGRGKTPNDYKLFVFNGRTEFILVVMGRFEERSHVMMTPDWRPVDVTWVFAGRRGPPPPPPPHLSGMLEAATRLGQDLDFARIDFYDTPEKLFFGELTATPGCGLERCEPASFDRVLGAHWQLVLESPPAGSGRALGNIEPDVYRLNGSS